MNKQKRRIGRAVRKQRRDQRELWVAFMAIDFDGLGTAMVDAVTQIGQVLTEATEATTRAFNEFAGLYAEAVAQQHRMTHMALTTGEGTE